MMDISEFKQSIIDKGRCTKNGVSGNVNIKVHGFGIGGCFTVLFNWLTLFGEDVENVYVDVTDEWKKTLGFNKNIFDLVLEQNKIDGANEITIFGHHLHNFNDEVLNYIRGTINKKIKIKPEILKKLDEYLTTNGIEDINSLCVVHVRLTDMDQYHKGVYGSVNFDTYLNEMKKLNDDVKFFIASDNNESIDKLKVLFKNRIYYIDSIDRVNKENDYGKLINLPNNKKTFKLGVDRVNSDEKIINDFIDLLALSRCNKIIGMKYSIYKIAALLFSNTITQDNNTELPLNFSL